MYYQFDSRMNLPEIRFEEDRIVVNGKSYDYDDIHEIKITKLPMLATYGIFEIMRESRPVVPVPFVKGDLHRLRTAVQEANHIIETYRHMRAEQEAMRLREAERDAERQAAEVRAAEEQAKQSDANTAVNAQAKQGDTNTAVKTQAGQGMATIAAETFTPQESTGAETLLKKASGSASVGAAGTAGVSYGAPNPCNWMDPYEQMKKLKELLDLDIITQEEFARKKKELLGL